MEVVSVPASGSVTAKACSLRSPPAIFGRYSLLLGAVPEERAHGVHLGVGRSGVGAAKIDLLEDGASGREVEAHPSVLLRYQGTEIAGPVIAATNSSG